jgi:hypothetical protein
MLKIPRTKLRIGNSGRIGALMEYKLIDAEGNEIPRDQPGELCLRGPNIMLGTPPLPHYPNTQDILTIPKQRKKRSQKMDFFEPAISAISAKMSNLTRLFEVMVEISGLQIGLKI